MDKSREGKLNNQEVVYFLALILLLFVRIIKLSGYSPYIGGRANKLAMLGVLGLIMLKELIDMEFQWRDIILMGLAGFLSMLVFKDLSLYSVPAVMILFAGRNIPFEKTAKVAIVTTLSLLLIIAISGRLGIIENYYFGEYTERARGALGFLYPLYAACLFTNVVTLIVYIKKRSVSYLWIIALALINVYIWRVTDSRLSFWHTTAFLALILIHKVTGEHLTVIKGFVKKAFIILIPIFIVMAIISIYFAKNYNEYVVWMFNLDEALEGRLGLAHKAMYRFGVSMFGDVIPWVGFGLGAEGNKSGKEYMYVDNMYIQVLIQYGIVFFVAALAIVTYVMYLSYRRRDYYLMLILSFIAVHSLIDDLMLRVWYNTFWIMLFVVMYQGLSEKAPETSFEKDKRRSPEGILT